MCLMDEVHENRLLSRWAATLPRSPRQVGAIHETDAELLPIGDGRLLALTVDSVLEEMELGLYAEPRTAGRVAAVAALSDLAAVGAEPAGLLLSVGLPSKDAERVQREVAEGVAETCRLAGTFVLGGDTNEAPALSVTCVAAGFVPSEAFHSRVGLRPGDALFASGQLGSGAALAAAAVLGLLDRPELEASYGPVPRIAEGRALRGVASACMDTSDGLVATLDQLARLNQVAVVVDAPLEPLLDPRAETQRRELGLSALPFLACQHGEFELVFGVPEAKLGRLDAASRAIGWRPVRLGRVEPGAGLFLGATPLDGARVRNLSALARSDLTSYVGALCSL